MDLLAKKILLSLSLLLTGIAMSWGQTTPQAPTFDKGEAPSASTRVAPRLVVQIVVSSMRPEELERYASHWGSGGFRRLMEGGFRYGSAAYNCQQTRTATSLATLTTGAMPSTHGVVCSRWFDYVDNTPVQLIADPSVSGLEYHTGGGEFSPHRLVAPTVGESLCNQSPDSRVVTIALDPESAVVMGGKRGVSFWMNDQLCHWRSSSYYLSHLPEWVKQYNRARTPQSFIIYPWLTLHRNPDYQSRRSSDVIVQRPDTKRHRGIQTAPIQELESGVVYHSDWERLCYTPAGNTALLNFAKLALTKLELGNDEAPDLLNLCLDASRYISEAYGPESIEVEDMYCRLDADLADFLTYLYAQVEGERVVVVLTSDHGTSPSYDLMQPIPDRFNVPQFQMIIESFLDARYGKGSADWVLGCDETMVYLNHNQIYEKRLSLADVQNEVATFAMQFRGVSHALSSTAMRNSYFGSGYAERMQNSFYPRRSGDVVLNLMPGWIEKEDCKRSTSGSMYGYDRAVPLLFYGWSIQAGASNREVEMECVAPTVARILGVSPPAACEGTSLTEVTR